MSGNPVHDAAIAKKVLDFVCANLVLMGLPFVIVVGLPDEGELASGVGRAACGMRDPRNREFMRQKVSDYLDEIAAGKPPNAKIGDS